MRACCTDGRFQVKQAASSQVYEGIWFRQPQNGVAIEFPRRLPPDGAHAKAIAARAKKGRAAVLSVDASQKRLPPPLLYDLTELQRHTNRLFGFSAQHTLDVAQKLYETHKIITYPRTSSRHLSNDVAATLGPIAASVRKPYEAHLAEGTGQRPLGKRYVDDAKITDHHAIIPTGNRPNGRLDQDEERVYDLVCRRFLQAWQPDFIRPGCEGRARSWVCSKSLAPLKRFGRRGQIRAIVLERLDADVGRAQRRQDGARLGGPPLAAPSRAEPPSPGRRPDVIGREVGERPLRLRWSEDDGVRPRP